MQRALAFLSEKTRKGLHLWPLLPNGLKQPEPLPSAENLGSIWAATQKSGGLLREERLHSPHLSKWLTSWMVNGSFTGKKNTENMTKDQARPNYLCRIRHFGLKMPSAEWGSQLFTDPENISPEEMFSSLLTSGQPIMSSQSPNCWTSGTLCKLLKLQKEKTLSLICFLCFRSFGGWFRGVFIW